MGLIVFRARTRKGAENQEQTGSLPRELHTDPLSPPCCGKQPALSPGPHAGGFSNEKLSKLPGVSSCSKGEWMCTNTLKSTSQFLESVGSTHTDTASLGRVPREGEAYDEGSALTSQAPRTTNRGLHSDMLTGYVSHREVKSNAEATRDRI